MDRLTGKDAQLMMEAVAAVYMKEEVDQEVISEEVEELDEQGLRSRPSGQQRARIRAERRQAAADLKATELAAGGGQAGIDNALKKRYGGRMPSERQQARHSSRSLATRSVAATGRENLYRGGGGDAAMKEKGQTRDQVIAQGVKNFKAKQSAPDTAPAAPANNAVASKPAAAPAPAKNNMAGASKEDRMAAWAKANPKLAAAKAARDASRGTSASTNPMMKDMPGKRPAPAPTGGAAKPVASAAKPVASAANRAAVAATATKNYPGGKVVAKSTGSPAAQAAAGAPNRKEDLFTGKPIPSAKPTGSPAAQAAAGAPNRKEDLFTGKPIPSAKPAPAGPAAKAAVPPVVKKKPAMGARNRMRMEEVDIFETIKEYLIGEGYNEDEALKAMTVLTDEERTEILEMARTTEAYDLTFSKPMKHVSTSPSGQKRYSTKDDGRHQRGVTPDGKPGGVNAPRTVGPGGAKIYNTIRGLKKRVFGDDYQPEGELVDEGSCGSKKKKKSKKGGY